jgi:hypothetical protein
LQKNIATFRCYGNISQAKYYVPPAPPSKTFKQKAKGKFVQTDRRAVQVKDLLLLSQKVEWKQ